MFYVYLRGNRVCRECLRACVCMHVVYFGFNARVCGGRDKRRSCVLRSLSIESLGVCNLALTVREFSRTSQFLHFSLTSQMCR